MASTVDRYNYAGTGEEHYDYAEDYPDYSHEHYVGDQGEAHQNGEYHQEGEYPQDGEYHANNGEGDYPADGTYIADGYQNDGYPADGTYIADGYQNDGSQNDGYQNDGYQNDGYQNDGYQNDGYQNDGYQNEGENTGFEQGQFTDYNEDGYDINVSDPVIEPIAADPPYIEFDNPFAENNVNPFDDTPLDDPGFESVEDRAAIEEAERAMAAAAARQAAKAQAKEEQKAKETAAAAAAAKANFQGNKPAATVNGSLLPTGRGRGIDRTQSYDSSVRGAIVAPGSRQDARTTSISGIGRGQLPIGMNNLLAKSTPNSATPRPLKPLAPTSVGTGLPAVDPQKGRAATMVANPVTAKPAEPQVKKAQSIRPTKDAGKEQVPLKLATNGLKPLTVTKEPVQQATRKHSPSLSRGTDLSDASDVPIPATVDPTAGLPPHKDHKSFRLKMLLESGKILVQIAQKTQTLTDIKKLLFTNEKQTGVSEAMTKKLAFKIPGAGFIAGEFEPIGGMAYFQNAAKRQDDPHLMLVRKDAMYFKAVKVDDVCIGDLLRQPIAWQQNDDETTAFKQCMARIRLQERINMEQEKKKITSLVPVALGDEPPCKKVIITLITSGDSTKKVPCAPEDTADGFLEKCFKYFPEHKDSSKKWSDYCLTAKGLNAHIAGPHKIFDIEYIQRCSLTNTEICLCLIPKKEVEVSKQEGRYIFEAEENFLSQDPVIHYDHQKITSGQGPANVKSVWDLTETFQVQVVSVINLPSSLIVKGSTVSVRMTIICGGSVADLIHNPLQTKDVAVANDSALINQAFTTPIKYCDLPRESKLVFSVWLGNKKVKSKETDNSLAWVNCLIYDYKNELRTGTIKLRMWNGNAMPSGTVVANPESSAVELTIQLRKAEEGIVRVFPTEHVDLPVEAGKGTPTGSDKTKLDACINYHSLQTLTNGEKELCRKYKTYCQQFPQALPKYLQSVVKTDRGQVQESHKLIQKWAPPKSPVDALELLDARYPDHLVRTYAVKFLEKLTNADVEDYLLQLVQVLKYELYHDSPLIRFLLRRALRNKRIGHYLYWFLKSELHNAHLSERFGLLLEAFLKGGGNAREEISAQEKVHQGIVDIAYKIKNLKSGDPVQVLKAEVANLNKAWPPGCQLMLDPLFLTKGIKVEKCKVMDSKMKPLWLLFENADPTGEDLNIIFKCGDDLRQDMLTLQLFRVMDKLWKKSNLDLMLNPYGVIATGAETGMIEVVTKSNTISKIQKQIAGASGAFDDTCTEKWLKDKNKDPVLYKLAVDNFIASCSGYCVATYALGIGDRHNDNIMLKEDGHLFHIDFGHILGNFKKKYGFKRERVPFVFTPADAKVMGGKDSEGYKLFVGNCMKSHEILRENAQLFINLLSMMLISGMPELSCTEDIMYVVDTLNVGVSEGSKKSKKEESFQGLIEASGTQFSTQFNFFVHNLVH